MPGPIAGASFSSFGSSVITASVVVINEETLKAQKERVNKCYLVRRSKR
jgi:hypothetical protein